MRNSFLVFGQPHIMDEEIQEVVDSMHKNWIGTGPKVKQFEIDFAKYKNTPYSAAVNSCTAALHLSCLALDLKPGDEVITTAMTFCATINAIIHSGAIPVLADINPKTLNIDPNQIEKHITKRTKALLIVHFAGRPCDMDAIIHIAKKYNLEIIEDCAHAIESHYKGKPTGTMGHFGCFSFYATKNISTGEGGMIVSRDKESIDRIKRMALHGLSADAWRRFSDEGYKHYFVMETGFKYNMMDLQAAMGIHQLKRIEQSWKRRENLWKRYLSLLADIESLTLPYPTEEDTRHSYHLFTIRIDEQKSNISRDKFLEKMTSHNIGIGVHYLPIGEHPYYQKKFHWKSEDYPQAMIYGRETVSLPLSPKMSEEDQNDVVNAIKDIFSESQKSKK